MSGNRSEKSASKALFLSFILVVSMVAAVPLMAGLGAAQSDAEVPDGESFGPADDVYIYENGTAVLAFEEENQSDELNQFGVGVDVASGLSHVLVEAQMDEAEGENVTASSTVWLRPDEFIFDGETGISAPDQLDNLDVDASGVTTDEENNFDVSASGSTSQEFEQTTMYVQDMSASSTGSMTVGPDSLSSAGSVTLEQSSSVSQPSEELQVSITESESGSYTADVEWDRPLYYNANRWNTSEKAELAVEQQFASFAEELGGSADVTIDSYSFSEETFEEPARVDMSFTVEYQGIDEGLEQTMAEEAANNPSSDLTEEEAREVAGYLTDVEVERVDFSNTVTDSATDVEWDVKLNGVNEAGVGMMESLYGSDMLEESNDTEEMINRTKTTLEARQAAELSTTAEWNVSFDVTPIEAEDVENEYSGQETSVSVDISSTSENWDAYVAEMEDRGEDIGTMSFDLTAVSEGEEIDAQVELEVGQEEMVQTAIDSMVSQVESQESVDKDTQRMVDALQESEFEVARMDLNMENETVEIEAGAKMDSYEEFLPEEFSGFSSVTSEMENESATMYVEVENFVGENQTVDAASLSTYDVVDEEETTVHAAGEWDREFPSMDKEAARNYLDLQGSEDEDGGIPVLPVAGGAAVAAGGVGAAFYLFKS